MCKLLYSEYFQLYWNRKLLNYVSCVLFEIIGVMVLSLFLLMLAVSSSTLLASLKLDKLYFMI